MRPVVLMLSHVNLRVRDVEASEAFYRDLFGFERLAPDPPGRNVRLCLTRGDHGADIEIVLSPGLPAGSELLGVDHFGLEVPTVFDVYAAYATAKTLGARTTHPRVYDGYWQAFVFDPDGYKIEVLTRDSRDPFADIPAGTTVGSRTPWICAAQPAPRTSPDLPRTGSGAQLAGCPTDRFPSDAKIQSPKRRAE